MAKTLTRTHSLAFMRTAVAASVLALIPITTGAIAAIDSKTQNEFARFMAIFEEVRANYVEPVDANKLMDGAISGMLSSLDPHSGYLDARDFEQLRTQTEGEYGGLGLSVTMEDGAVKVIAPTAGTPADRAGIKSGDYITHLDGKLIFGETLDEAVEQMRGTPGTKIALTLVRPGRDKPIDVTITREVIVIKPVKWEVKNNIGVISIASFSETTTADLKAAIAGIDKALGKKPTGYVLDLRSNPGGLLDEAIGVSDVFLNSGEIVSQRGRTPRDTERYFARAGDLTGGKPIVVLIDEGSASASEIVAGALQDHKRALIMGETSFGKGSVQTVLPITEDTALRLTTARYYTPSGRSVQEGGIDPDIKVPQLSDPDYKTRPKFREADLRRHLINEKKVDNSVLEEDTKEDPRFNMTAEQLKKQGIEDFQLDYALKTIARIASGPQMATGATGSSTAAVAAPAVKRN